MTAIGIDLDIGDTVRAIDEILARRASAETTVWDSLRDELEAIAQTTMALDEMYLSLLTEIEDIIGQPEPSAERIAAVIRQGHIYCSDRKLLGRLIELHAAVRVAALHEDLKRRRYVSIQGLALRRHLPYGTCDEPGVVVRRGLAGQAGLVFCGRS